MPKAPPGPACGHDWVHNRHCGAAWGFFDRHLSGAGRVRPDAWHCGGGGGGTDPGGDGPGVRPALYQAAPPHVYKAHSRPAGGGIFTDQLPGLLASRKAALALVGKLASSLEKQCDFGGTAKLSPLRRGIQLQNVCYSYDGKTDALRNVSAFFQAGGAYAVVGGSGSGKSTLLNLLMGTAGAYTGQILLDDTELRTVAPEALFQLISLIQQNVFVFHASIRDNLTLFRNFPPQQIDAAIQQAHLTDLVAARGQDYLCGENGGGLSGGEKQRISIGRSLLKNASVLLADEMTAALDAQTAHQVTEDLLSLRGITRIVVTHRLEASLLRRYNGIVVLKDGRVAETGSFDELMAQKGYFYALYTVAQ